MATPPATATATAAVAATAAAAAAPGTDGPSADGSAKAAAKAQLAAQLTALLADLGVDTGDVVIFDRKCASMSLYGGAICACAKLFGDTRWDHNGVVVRDPATQELLFLEATLSGVKMRPLVERLLRSQSHDVAVRRLQVPRGPDFHARAIEFARHILNSPYEDRPQLLLNAGLNVPTRLGRERLFQDVIAAKKELRRLDQEIQHRHHMSPFERNALLKERDAVHERYHGLVEQLSHTERSMFENELVVEPMAKRKMFCSQLVASFYQHLGLLLPYPSANSYLPKHFSSAEQQKSGYLNLQLDAVLLPEVSVRRELETNAALYRRLVEESQSRAPRDSDASLPTLLHCLRRHPLFHTLSESELIKVAARFRRREVQPGEVVFYQGAPGDFFYIIERGECDVFVDYDYLQRTRTREESETLPADGANAEQLQLRRRKTLALPDFQNSSSLIANQRVLVATNGPGSAFGDSALIYDTPRRATVQASGARDAPPIVLWQLDRTAFRRVLEEHPGPQHSMEEYLFLMQTLSEHPLFSALDARAKALAVRKCFPLTFRAGTTVLRQGDPGDYFYVIESGRCEIARQKPRLPSPVVDRVVGRGATFGEAALLYNSRRGASVRALEDGTKLWCMDRASFLTITRSGSAAMLQLFRRVSGATHRRDGSDEGEAFLSDKDLQRMLRGGVAALRGAQAAAAASATASADATAQRSPEALERAVKLATALLLHDASGLVSFSQFAHVHMALGATNADQLLPEAAFRVLNALAHDQEQEQEQEHGDTSDSEQSAIRLDRLTTLMRRWASGEPETEAQAQARTEHASRRLFQRLLELPSDASDAELASHRVSCDDLARAIASLSDDDAESSEEDAGARQQLEAFAARLKQDLAVLREVWRAAELHASDGLDVDAGKRALTFDANLRSGWISAIRHNATAGDWDSLQASASPMITEHEPDGGAHEPTSQRRLYAQLTSFSAAISAGVLSRTVCAPLERLKILMQAAAPMGAGAARPPAPYTSLGRGLLNMLSLGGVRSLYSGNLAHCLWVIPSLPTKFLLCDVIRSQLQPPTPHKTAPRQRSAEANAINLLAGGLAGVAANSLLYPLDVVRGRLSVQQYYDARRSYRGVGDAFARVYEREGLRAFYRGFAPASLGVFSYIGCNYAIYEFLRPIFILYDTEAPGSHQLGHPSIPGQIVCATLASLASQTISYPFDLLRRRMQLQGVSVLGPDGTTAVFPSYGSTWKCVAATLNETEPPLASRVLPRVSRLYRGLWVNCVKALPSAVISFVSYEKIRELKQTVDE
ncbi:hypothetical protein P43SY_002337 [Pythium insidiosum]|uniref:Cyclic nucleotide-binding domain-containing protein n=1 Tax=Pythium insidiosum TaxID=114742 RepID=A0AAD5QAT7_PYTIN|nr:hypothetical protein P43SY_002337 [Pythium insidiosum]